MCISFGDEKKTQFTSNAALNNFAAIQYIMNISKKYFIFEI